MRFITGLGFRRYAGALGLFCDADAMSHDARRQDQCLEFTATRAINRFQIRRGAAWWTTGSRPSWCIGAPIRIRSRLTR